MPKPVIGITAGFAENGDVYLRRQYCAAIEAAGGVPLILPPSAAADALSVCRGLLLSGGGDVRPELYGLHDYDRTLLFEPSDERDRFESELTRLAVGRGLPILAICRGIQVLNVALGGSLRYDIPGHRQTLPRPEPSHTVTVEPDSLLFSLTGCERLWVNSFHHQAVGRTAEGLRVTAAADDGTIEAIEGLNGFLLGVQWHPEHMPTEAARALFRGLISAAEL